MGKVGGDKERVEQCGGRASSGWGSQEKGSSQELAIGPDPNPVPGLHGPVPPK